MTRADGWDREVRALLRRQRENGGPFWSRDDGDIHAPSGFSTIDVLGVLGELGATVDDPDIAAAAEFVLGYQQDDGAFRYGRKSSKLPCFAGRITATLCRVGMAGDDRLESSYRWMLEHQHEDGGWRCATVKVGKSPETDASNPGTTLYVLDAFRFRANARGDAAALARGVDSLLRHWETRQPMGPCAFGIGSRFLAVEYPFLRYNLFHYVHVLSHYPAAHDDARFQDALAQLSTRLRDGEMVVEAPHRAWQDAPFARKGKTSPLATLRWREIQDNLDGRARTGGGAGRRPERPRP